MQNPRNRAELIRYLMDNPGLQLQVTRTTYRTRAGADAAYHYALPWVIDRIALESETEGPVRLTLLGSDPSSFAMTGEGLNGEVYTEAEPAKVPFVGKSNGCWWHWRIGDGYFAILQYLGECQVGGEPGQLYRCTRYDYAADAV